VAECFIRVDDCSIRVSQSQLRNKLYLITIIITNAVGEMACGWVMGNKELINVGLNLFCNSLNAVEPLTPEVHQHGNLLIYRLSIHWLQNYQS